MGYVCVGGGRGGRREREMYLVERDKILVRGGKREAQKPLS